MSSEVKDEFRSVWREITGKEYGYYEVSLTQDELNSLPTIIFQMKASNIVSENDFLEPDNTYSKVGTEIDEDSSYDVFLAVPATQYMEFVEERKRYRCRLSLEGDSGTIIGANALQGKHINFDLDNSRIGFAEQTSCNQPIIKEQGVGQAPGLIMGKETGELAATLQGAGEFDSFSFNNVYIGALSFLLLIMFVLVGTAIRKS
uniref:Peptidase A1 domain-containing protein n=1 Tax=Helicotheca tamesis TaxID=374047 RepID=A0A7S2N3A3_9STRA